MAKEALKRQVNELQNGNCALSGDILPDETKLYDTDRKKPKAKGGIYTIPNTRVVVPVAHMQHHGIYRKRQEELSELKIMVDARRQIMKSKNKITNQLLAYKRGTDVLDSKTLEFLMDLEKQIKKELGGRDRLLAKRVEHMENNLAQIALSVKAVGPITVAHCLVYVDLEKARHASSLWSYIGLDKPSHERYTKGEAGGGNKTLRTVLYTMADCQVKHRGPYRKIYDQVKTRLEVSDKIVKSYNTQGKLIECAWKDTKPCHRHGAGLRAIMKHFLADYWFVGRTLMGLGTSPCYAEAMLGKTHKTVMPRERGWIF